MNDLCYYIPFLIWSREKTVIIISDKAIQQGYSSLLTCYTLTFGTFVKESGPTGQHVDIKNMSSRFHGEFQSFFTIFLRFYL